MKTISMQWTGLRPLVMSNPQTVQVSNPHSVESRRLNSLLKAARKKEDGDRLIELETDQRKNDFAASAYWADGDFYLPDTVIVACLREAAKASKKGRDIDRAVLMSETEAVIETRKRFKSLDEAFKDDAYRLECPCKVPPKTGALIWKCRAMIPTGWVLRFNLEFDEGLIAEKTLVDIATTAGALVGVGGWRPKFGRFTVEVKG